jgi:L-alanine-DL-glutamate epimerase-like enolase superfamily enzyme
MVSQSFAEGAAYRSLREKTRSLLWTLNVFWQRRPWTLFNPALRKMGGISELRQLFPIAAVRNVTVTPLCFYDVPGLLANIHTTAALGTADAMIEWRYFDLEAQIYGGRLNPANGRISVPQRPGLGINPDPDVIREYLRS